MQWDLVQAIHRIRPVHKDNVDIILAANSWPSMLQEPDHVIDKSQSTNWKELSIKRLEPFVEAFGFLNQDIGFLANVYVKSKESVAKRFKENLEIELQEINSRFSEVKSKFSTSASVLMEDFDSSGYISFKDNDELLEDMRIKLILVIYNIYNQNSLKQKFLYDQLLNLSKNQHDEWINTNLILSNSNQWTGLLIHFKEINHHFETFKIKLPHARGNAVTGVGNSVRVKEFYKQINDLGIVKKIDLNSYQVVDQSKHAVKPIPDGFASIYIPDGQDIAFVGWGSEFTSISLNQEPAQLRSFFKGMLKDPQIKIITNNGKQVAKAFLSCGLPVCEIIDVIMAEKLIANGEVEYQAINLKTVFKRHGFSEGLERSMVVQNLVDLWFQQEILMHSGGLEKIFDIEKRLIWVTSKIESTGIGVDIDQLLDFHDALTNKSKSLATVLEKMIPEGISLNDRFKIKEHLNTNYALSLAEINDETIRTISNAEIRALCCNLLEYWKAVREKGDVEYYMSITGLDDRVRDSIEQLNTKTGRFYRRLQTVQKVGPMRSLFRAKKGYKFIVADYSQQEARIIAGLSNDQVAIDLFKAGKDIYLETAKIILGPAGDSPLYRNLGKEMLLGLNNGRSAYSIFESLERLGFGYDVDDVQGMILRYDMTFSGIRTWRDSIGSMNFEGGVISTALGRTLKISNDVKVNSLYNYPVQGTAADGFKIALINLDDQLADQDARIVHILHDEVIVEARTNIANSVAVTVKNCMEKAFSDILPEVPFVVEPEKRDSWG
jgi:hypothetical protein